MYSDEYLNRKLLLSGSPSHTACSKQNIVHMATMLPDRCRPSIIFSALKSLRVLLGRSGLLLPTEYGLLVCRSVTLVSPAKTAEAIEMPFGLWNRIGMGFHVLDGVQRC